ncbi:uncharacterized protein M421DRAFT_409510 [Didymella exigua CBS 183.55]|uniref:Uncharacterized protein n=1 Tax=Didymella exigua CBS 183.55 TaxID=1150837 RepID=A0A6A5R509_9PLEO|nr:uncharacterized protein M421DRAFT_409510 [Didymella exigua CBS 183.55]KAF1922723.1 hypothetical protein M421DRAFT_409510 [Didymella exigua CBS 183.55]
MAQSQPEKHPEYSSTEHSSTPTVDTTHKAEPPCTPRRVIDVFIRDGVGYVEVALYRESKAINPERTVYEHFPQTFTVDVFKQTFVGPQHGRLQEQLNEKIAELKSNEAGDEKASTWNQRLTCWLHCVFLCFPAVRERSNGRPPDPIQVGDMERRNTINKDDTDSQVASGSSVAEQKRVSRQPDRVAMMGCTWQVASTEQSDQNLQTSTQQLLPFRPTTACDRQSAHSVNTSLSVGDTVIWVESLKATRSGVWATKILVRRNQECLFLRRDISFEELCLGREDNIEGVVGSFDYSIALSLHWYRRDVQYAIYTGPPIEQVVAASQYRQVLKKGGIVSNLVIVKSYEYVSHSDPRTDALCTNPDKDAVYAGHDASSEKMTVAPNRKKVSCKIVSDRTSIFDGGAIGNAEADSQMNAIVDCIRAHNTAPVPHKTCTLDLPVYLSEFKASTRVKICLPILAARGLALNSLGSITGYLTAFRWSRSCSIPVRTECQELLESLAKVAKDLLPVIRDEATKTFLVLLSRLGEQVLLKGVWFEFCGLGSKKAVVRHEGEMQTIDLDVVAKYLSKG